MQITCTGMVRSVNGVRDATVKLQFNTVFIASNVAVVFVNNMVYYLSTKQQLYFKSFKVYLKKQMHVR